MADPEDKEQVSVCDPIDNYLGSDEEDKKKKEKLMTIVTKKRNGSSSWLKNMVKKR